MPTFEPQDPYFDDFDPTKGYEKILFKPGLPVQTRELNQLQTILQDQVERFGDSIYQTGTIIRGCNFNYISAYPYAKLLDQSVGGALAIPAQYISLFATCESSGLSALVIDYQDGFELTSPNLKTIYLKYNNAGNDSDTHAFSPGDTLTITDANDSIFEVNINNGGVGFSNSDFIVFTPALVVNVASGSFSNGDFVVDPTTGGNLQIINIDDTTLAPQGQVILSMKPRNADLINAAANSQAWTIANGDSIKNTSNTAQGTVESVYGRAAAAAILTDGTGKIIDVIITERGLNYVTAPQAQVRSSNNSSGVGLVNLTAQNFLTQVTIANTVDAVGNGYAFAVSNGIIYQQGAFLRVAGQTVIVDKYDQSPNAISAGFQTVNQIINSDIDPTLLDNAAGSNNYLAPGADRLQMIPELVVFGLNGGVADILPIVSWSGGNPYKQSPTTQLSTLGDTLAQRTFESSGNFVLDQFLVTTESPFQSNLEGSTVQVVVDPGTAYIDGYRVQTLRNFVVGIDKGINTKTTANVAFNLNYDDWLPVDNLGGVFQFNTGDTVQLYDTPKGYLSNHSFYSIGNTQPIGNKIGTASIRSLTTGAGVPGTPTASYQLYMFNVQMSNGCNFANVGSVFYNGPTTNGICDVITTLNPNTSLPQAAFGNSLYDSLLFKVGRLNVQNAANNYYQYRTLDQTVTISNTGILTRSSTGSPNETFPFAGSLNAGQLSELYLIPTGAGLQASVNAAGTVVVNTTTPNCVGTSTTFITTFQPGDWVYLYQNSTVNDIHQVITVVNNTVMILDSVCNFTGSGDAIYRYFPKYVPIPLGTRLGFSANVDSAAQNLTINLGMNFLTSTTTAAALGVNIQRSGVSASSKSANRNQFVKIDVANNAGGTVGPWCLGVADIFRLDAVYLGSNSSVNTSSPNITQSFYVDNNQNQDFLDLSFLYRVPGAAYQPQSGDWLLVQFDYFTTAQTGFFATTSYVGSNTAVVQATDSLPVSNLTSGVNSFEVPEVFTAQGDYYDLLKCIDFRPIAVASATPTGNTATAPINPVEVVGFGNTANSSNDRKFPVPDSTMFSDLTIYTMRVDSVFCGDDGSIFVARGHPSTGSIRKPNQPKNSIRLNDLLVPGYPNLPVLSSNMQIGLCTTRIANERYSNQRQAKSIIGPVLSQRAVMQQQPMVFTQRQIGSLANRISNLEYYASLTLLQTSIANQVIPSSVDPLLDRFQFGFLADGFTTYVSQDSTNPQYAAEIEVWGSNNYLTPETIRWVNKFGPGQVVAPSYVSYPIIAQDNATTPPVLPVANTTLPPANVACTTNTAQVETWALRVDQDMASSPGGGGFSVSGFVQQDTDSFNVVMSATAGPVTFWFAIPSVVENTGTSDPVSFAIYQNGTEILSGDNAVALNGTDVANVSQNAPAEWMNGQVAAGNLTDSGGFLSGSGKITWTHNPAQGQNYTIVSTRASSWDHWRWALNYPADESVTVCPAGVTASAASYSGTMDVTPPTFLLTLGNLAGVEDTDSIAGNSSDGNLNAGGYTVQNQSLTYTTDINTSGGENHTYGGNILDQYFGGTAQLTLDSQAFFITVYGLKPNCTHSFTAAGVDQTSQCQPYGGTFGAPLVSGADGTLKFSWYWNASVDQNVTGAFGAAGADTSITTSAFVALIAPNFQPTTIGSLALQVSAPNSTASFTVTVGESIDVYLGVNFSSNPNLNAP